MKHLLTLITLVFGFGAHASECPNLYPKGKPIAVPDVTELCNSFFVTGFDGKNNAVVFSSELLKKDALYGSLNRINAFHMDGRIKNGPSASAYVGADLDKGHMTPSDDASTKEEMRETFLMTNMTPQEPTLNRGSWKYLEGKVRKEAAESNADAWVLTVAIYNDGGFMHNIPKPIGYWKILYTNRGTKYYFAENKPDAAVTQHSNINAVQLLKQARKY